LYDAAGGATDILDPRAGTCRDRLRQVLEPFDGGTSLPIEDLMALVAASKCEAGHEMHYASLMDGFVEVDSDACKLGRRGTEWLIRNARPAPDWRGSVPPHMPPLRDWQVEALDAWAHHGRRGVVEAVTGTGKSRVGIEAAREALWQDYSVVVVVPTRDLVDQWEASLRAAGIPRVGVVGDGRRAGFDHHHVLVGTVQSFYKDPPTRDDGKVLLVADECHRYGAEQWGRALHPSYRRRLGLTATFERNDDGLASLLDYFEGTPLYRIGFDRAIADGVVARYRVKLHGVALQPHERRAYDEAHEAVVDCRTALITAGFSEEPFGLFLQEVQEAAEDRLGREDPRIVDLARRYLKAFSERIRIMSSAAGKMDAVRAVAPRVQASAGALLFTRTVEAAVEIAEVLNEEGVSCEAIHSRLTRPQRRQRLAELKATRLKAIAAPTVLDEGVDVPAIDLAVVLGGSKSRRQMIQRMGRVLRLKADGGHATFIVVYAKDTVEDLTQNDGQEGCLDLIIGSADDVEHVDEAGLGTINDSVHDEPMSRPFALQSTTDVHARELDRVAGAEAISSGTDPVRRRLSSVDADRLPMTRLALQQFVQFHGGDDARAESTLRETLRDFLWHAMPTEVAGYQPSWVLKLDGLELGVGKDRFRSYRSRREDALTWPELKAERLAGRSLREPKAWRSVPWPSSPDSSRVLGAIAELGPLDFLPISDDAIDDYAASHGCSPETARLSLGDLLAELSQDQDRCGLTPTLLTVSRSGYGVGIDRDARAVASYTSSGQLRPHGDYVAYGRLARGLKRLAGPAPEEDTPLRVESTDELLALVDFRNLHVPSSTYELLTRAWDHAHFNDWDFDRLVRHRVRSDVGNAGRVQLTTRGAHAVEGDDFLWLFRSDGLSVRAISDKSSLERMIEPAQPATAAIYPASTSPRESIEPSAIEDAVIDAAGIVGAIERLVELKKAGYLSDEEFAAAKAKVLA
jgi:superfamily II DNA or RNA helicase